MHNTIHRVTSKLL